MQPFLQNLLVVVCASSGSVALDINRSPRQHWARDELENVVLVDCTGTQNKSELSSEVAYFGGAPDESPDDIAPVTSGQYRDWANKTTSAYYSATGVVFEAVLGVRGGAGDYAGTGTNGSSASATPAASSGLSVGAIVGLSIGVAAGAIILAAIAAFLVWRHRRSNQQADAANPSEKRPLSDQVKLPKDPQSPVFMAQEPGNREMEIQQVYHELHNEYRPAEIYGEAIRGELDGQGSRVELHSQDLPPRYDGNYVNPGAYGAFKGPI
ncbi:hypothetical protein AAE478_004047 [Parahypoxylon ruwenzoriense]